MYIYKFIKKYNFYLTTLVYVVALFSLYPFEESEFTLLASATGVFLSILYFFQKQNLEELKVFKELFTDFNKRYDLLNNKLNHIETITNNRDLLDDYFNLCAEEYLFYQKGLILDEVWGAWCRGILLYLENKVISDYWEDAQKDNTYYGLNTSKIINGAKK